MTVIFSEKSSLDMGYETAVWQEVASKTGVLRPVENYLHFSAEYTGNIIENKPLDTIPVEIRVLINGVEVGADHFRPIDNTKYRKFGDFGVINPSSEMEYTISLEVRAFNTGQTVKVRRIRLMVMQV